MLPETNGVSKDGKEWRKQEAVLQTNEQYQRSVCFRMFNDRIVPLQIGQMVDVIISIESREWQGRWYTDINASAVFPIAPQVQDRGSQSQQTPQSGGVIVQPSDLPF